MEELRLTNPVRSVRATLGPSKTSDGERSAQAGLALRDSIPSNAVGRPVHGFQPCPTDAMNLRRGTPVRSPRERCSSSRRCRLLALNASFALRVSVVRALDDVVARGRVAVNHTTPPPDRAGDRSVGHRTVLGGDVQANADEALLETPRLGPPRGRRRSLLDGLVGRVVVGELRPWGGLDQVSGNAGRATVVVATAGGATTAAGGSSDNDGGHSAAGSDGEVPDAVGARTPRPSVRRRRIRRRGSRRVLPPWGLVGHSEICSLAILAGWGIWGYFGRLRV